MVGEIWVPAALQPSWMMSMWGGSLLSCYAQAPQFHSRRMWSQQCDLYNFQVKIPECWWVSYVPRWIVQHWSIGKEHMVSPTTNPKSQDTVHVIWSALCLPSLMIAPHDYMAHLESLDKFHCTLQCSPLLSLHRMGLPSSSDSVTRDIPTAVDTTSSHWL